MSSMILKKVDTHIHLSAAISPKDLLDYIKQELRNNPDEIVLNGKSLVQICNEANVTLGIVYYHSVYIHITNPIKKIFYFTITYIFNLTAVINNNFDLFFCCCYFPHFNSKEIYLLIA